MLSLQWIHKWILQPFWIGFNKSPFPAVRKFRTNRDRNIDLTTSSVRRAIEKFRKTGLGYLKSKAYNHPCMEEGYSILDQWYSTISTFFVISLSISCLLFCFFLIETHTYFESERMYIYLPIPPLAILCFYFLFFICIHQNHNKTCFMEKALYSLMITYTNYEPNW